eukprot:TRINITY_DN9634_c0_g1_i4.p1 TRINITY_DN9634_c0_g1~~TRINITY_DN9634_c0_g1_i4.p1  ORF type:complete len:121 (+),score=38.71 TRINITY_DN9634_c0_g1_i4:97-459(+)
MIRRPPRSTLSSSSAASDVYKRQMQDCKSLVALNLDPFTSVLLSPAPADDDTAPGPSSSSSVSSAHPAASSLLSAATTVKQKKGGTTTRSVSYTHLRAHETPEHLVCRLLLEKKKKKSIA